VTDATLMQVAAQDLADALEASALDIGWIPDSVCVMPYEPVDDCLEAIYVWPSLINPRHELTCQVSSLVTLTFWISQCSTVASCEDATQNASVMHERIWGTWAGLLNLWKTNAIFTTPCLCNEVRFGTLGLLEGTGNALVWQGSVNLPISPRDV